MPSQIFLVRHGETEWSLAGRHTSRTDLPLTEAGEQRACELAAWLRDTGFSRVFTSPRQRAQRTCELAGLGPVAGIEPDLAEWDYGDYEGRHSTDILSAHPGWDLFRDGCPGGETPALVSARADRLIARLRQLEGNVALFTHGHFGRVLGARWIGLPVTAARHFLLGTASLSVLGHEHDQAGQPAIVRWNVTPHDMPGPEAETGGPADLKPRALDRWENEGGEIPSLPRNQEERGPSG
jgi:probable phosphoglycerate mutase